jgi:hypothetical protein
MSYQTLKIKKGVCVYSRVAATQQTNCSRFSLIPRFVTPFHLLTEMRTYVSVLGFTTHVTASTDIFPYGFGCREQQNMIVLTVQLKHTYFVIFNFPEIFEEIPLHNKVIAIILVLVL